MTSFSQSHQDLFVTSLIKEPGFFLDIGSATPISGNNSFLLEMNGWNGVLIDRNICNSKEIRRNPSIEIDVTKINWEELLITFNVPRVIDYISLDVDDASIDCIKRFPFDKYEFKVLTFETDLYLDGDNRKNECFNVLNKYGFYDRILENAKYGDWEFEDWWINTKYINVPVRGKSIRTENFVRILQDEY